MKVAGTRKTKIEYGLLEKRMDYDLKLGKIIKKNGFRQEFFFGHQMIKVEWYSSVKY